MVPEIILIAVFFIALGIIKLRSSHFEFRRAARIAMSAMLLMTATGHFMFTEGMTLMLPEFMPFKPGLVYLTGIFEIIMAAGLLIQKTRMTTGWMLIVFFVLLLPANIYGAINHVNLEKATYDGPGPEYLYFRVPLQLFFIAWVYFAIKKVHRTQYFVQSI